MEKTNTAEKNRRQQEKRETRYEIDRLHKRSQRNESMELSRAVRNRTLWTSLIHRVTRSGSQLNDM